MAQTAQIINLYLDQSKMQLCDVNGYEANNLQIYVNSYIIFRITCYQDFTSMAPFDYDVPFLAGWDSTYVTHHPDLILVPDSDFNLVADWSAADPSIGKVCFHVDTSDPTLVTFLNQESYKTIFFDIWSLDNWALNILDCAATHYLMNVTTEPI